MVGWLQVQLSYERPQTIGGMPFMGVFLWYPNPYLRNFLKKKTWKTPKDFTVKILTQTETLRIL